MMWRNGIGFKQEVCMCEVLECRLEGWKEDADADGGRWLGAPDFGPSVTNVDRTGT